MHSPAHQIARIGSIARIPHPACMAAPTKDTRSEQISPPNRIREWRHRRGMTQQDLCDATSYSAMAVYRMEAGTQRLNEDHLARLAKALRCEPWELLKGTDGVIKPGSSDWLPDDTVMQVIRLIEDWSHERRLKLSADAKARLAVVIGHMLLDQPSTDASDLTRVIDNYARTDR